MFTNIYDSSSERTKIVAIAKPFLWKVKRHGQTKIALLT